MLVKGVDNRVDDFPVSPYAALHMNMGLGLSFTFEFREPLERALRIAVLKQGPGVPP